MPVSGLGWGRAVALAGCVGITAACGKDSQAPVDTGPKASELRIRPPSVDLKQLDSTQIVPSVFDDKGVLLSGVPVTFTSGDPAMVTVSNAGVITSVGPAGSTTITAKALSLTATVPVTVSLVATKLTLDPNPVALPQKGNVTLTARLLDKVDKPIPNAPITFASSDTLLVKVGTHGVATSIGPAGTVSITARSGDFFATTTVAVTQVATSIQPLPTRLRLGRMRTQQLGAQVLDAVGARITSLTNFTFTSLSPALVTVAADGTVTSVGPLGTGTVRIAAAGTPLTIDVPVEVLATTSPTGAQPVTYPAPNLYAVTFAGDSMVGSTLDFKVVVANSTNGQSRTSPLPMYALGVAHDPSRNTTFVAELSGRITQIDHARGMSSEFMVLSTEVLSLAVSADSRSLLVGSSGKLLVIDIATKTARTIAGSVYALHLSLHPDGKRVFASGDGSLAVVDIVAGTMRNISTPGGYTQANAVSSDGRYLWLAFENSLFLGVLDLSNESLTTVPTTCGSWGLALTRDDRYAYVGCGGVVVVIDAVTRTEVRRFPVGTEVRRLTMSPDGSVAVAGSGTGFLVFR